MSIVCILVSEVKMIHVPAAKVAALVSSWLSLAVSLVSAERAWRNWWANKQPMELRHVPLVFVWRLAEVGGRVLCLALFASAFKHALWAVVLPHWALMALWCYRLRSIYKDKVCLYALMYLRYYIVLWSSGATGCMDANVLLIRCALMQLCFKSF